MKGVEAVRKGNFFSFRFSNKVKKAQRKIDSYLGEGTRLIKNDAGDPVFLSKDCLRKVRFDFKNPNPHNNPHMHVEYFKEKKWIDTAGQIYPWDVPHN